MVHVPVSPAREGFPPLESSELAEEAGKFDFNPQIPLKNYVGALDVLYREGRNYLREQNFAKAYLLLFRYSILLLEKVDSLPEARTAEGRRLLKPAKKRLEGVLAELERIKPALVEARNRWQAEHASSARRTAQTEDNESHGFASRDAALSWNAQARATLLDASAYQDFAVELATEELSRRKAIRRAGISEEEESQRRTGGVWDDWDRASATEASYASTLETETQRQMERARRQLDQHGHEWSGNNGQPQPRDAGYSRNANPAPVSYHYPNIARPAPVRYDASPPEQRTSQRAAMSAVRPPRPAKDSLNAATTLPPQVPGRYDAAAPALPPRRELGTPAASQDLGQLSPSGQLPSSAPRPPPKVRVETAAPDEAAEKETFTFRPAGYLEDGTPIRPVFLPEGLRKEFVRMVASNTKKGIETCGILCGTNINNALFITCLLIPEQRGTPDTCETTNEAATFEFFDREDLLQIGWIHTHPTQTCFMSSRDLHTQAGYQIMMDESVAIVCAPRHDPSWGVFRLTKPPGLQHLLNCEHTDTFHQHSLPADALYRNSQNPPGHVFVTSRMDYWIHDLRKES